MKVLITGSNGQLGRQLQKKFSGGVFTDAGELDITDLNKVSGFNLNGIDAIINAAAYTKVDDCEYSENYPIVWKINVQGVANLAARAYENDIPFVHISTDYVFDGSKKEEYEESDQINPQSVYGKSKAASEFAATYAPKHYLIRTSWVVGDGHNFVKTMLGLADKSIHPSVVSDQVGRPTFTPDLAGAIKHLLDNKARYGTYHISSDGELVSWADFARAIFKEAGKEIKVTNTTTKDYFKDKQHFAIRPLNSSFNLTKIKSTGFYPEDWRTRLSEYIKKETSRE